jgi:hypothetical protein
MQQTEISLQHPRPERPLLALMSVVAIGLIGLLAYSTIAASLGCSENDEALHQQSCPGWFQDRSAAKTLVMLDAYVGSFLVLIAAAASIGSRRARYLVWTSAVTAAPMVVLLVSRHL